METGNPKTGLSCPHCGNTDLERWDRRNWVVIHWLLNPGLCINELLLGMRLPKVTLVCRTCALPLADRSYVPCMECGTLNPGRLWAGKNAFGHWFGFVCPACGTVIPCVRNIWSLLILAVTFPLWYLPVFVLKYRWLEVNRRRSIGAGAVVPTPPRVIPWLRPVVLWLSRAALVFSLVCVLVAVIRRRDWEALPALAVLFVLVGAAWLLFRLFSRRRSRRGSGRPS